MSIVITITVIALVGCIIAQIRNYLVYRIRSRAIDYIYSYNMSAIKNNSERLSYDLLENPGYYSMMWNFRKWNYKQFYPEFK